MKDEKARRAVPVSRIWRTLAIAAVAWAATAAAAQQARASAPHTVLPGETLWSIAASYNFTTRTVAAFNGLSEDALVYAGETIQIPTEAEGAAALASAGVATTSSSSPSTSTVPHLVTPGESLWSIAAANGLSVETLAATNGLGSDSLLLIGQTIQVPGSSASASTGAVVGGPPAPDPPYWVAPIYCPCGEVYLASNAAAAWEAMRQESLSVYGIDLYPDGTLSGYRSYAQQLYLYNLYLAGQGSLAAVPGTSVHEYGTAVDLAEPSMRTVVDQIGANYGWAKVEAPDEWWHVNYVGP
jgi:LysM repeat protein